MVDLPVRFPCINDLVGVLDGEGWIVGILDAMSKESFTVRWGDSERTVRWGATRAVGLAMSNKPRCAGILVGKRFPSLDAFIRASNKHSFPRFGGRCGATCAHGTLPSPFAGRGMA